MNDEKRLKLKKEKTKFISLGISLVAASKTASGMALFKAGLLSKLLRGESTTLLASFNSRPSSSVHSSTFHLSPSWIHP